MILGRDVWELLQHGAESLLKRFAGGDSGWPEEIGSVFAVFQKVSVARASACRVETHLDACP
jgi:hypothetical protein